MLHPAIVVQPSRIAGKGLYATAFIPAGTLVWDDAGERYHPVTRAQMQAWPRARLEAFLRICYQVDTDLFDGPQEGEKVEDSMHMNHSCDPNTWFTSATTMTARRDIRPGDEVTYDYSTSDVHEFLRLACRCGSPLCRGVVTGRDLLERPELQARYAGPLMPHVQRAVDAARRSR